MGSLPALRQSCLYLTLLCLCSLPAHATRKTDVITLYNGDRVTGEIKSMAGGLLSLSTDAMDTISIQWQEIADIQSKYNYEVRLSDGRRYYGNVTSGERPGDLTVADMNGRQELDYLDIVELRPVEEKISDRFDAYLSAGYSYTKASSVAQTTFNTDLSYEDRVSLNALKARTTITDTDEESSRSSKLDLSRLTWTDRAQYFRALYGNYEDNDELNLEYRISGGTGLGRYFLDTQRSRLLAAAGLQALTERGDSGDRRESIEAFATGEYSLWRFDSPELDLRLSLDLYPSLTESGRFRGNTDLRLRWELIHDLFWDITAYGSYDNEADSERRFDYGVTTGVGWEY